VRHDASAALPLTGFILGLLTATGFAAAAGLLAVAILLWRFSPRGSIFTAFVALGLAMGSVQHTQAIDQDRFTIVAVSPHAMLDADMRAAAGLKVPANHYKGAPLYIFTKANVKKAGTPPDPAKGYGEAYHQGFAKLWGVG